MSASASPLGAPSTLACYETPCPTIFLPRFPRFRTLNWPAWAPRPARICAPPPAAPWKKPPPAARPRPPRRCPPKRAVATAPNPPASATGSARAWRWTSSPVAPSRRVPALGLRLARGRLLGRRFGRRSGLRSLRGLFGGGNDGRNGRLGQQVANLGEQLFFRRRGGRRRGGRFGGVGAADLVDQLDQQEHHGRDDEELDQGVDEGAVLDSDLLDRLGGRILRPQHPFQLGEVQAAGQQADGRHDHLVDQALDDAVEGRADDHADGQVDDVAAGDELAKFLDDAHAQNPSWLTGTPKG
ncbi:conserved hypothetical protein [Ricinus communis]|uniref:Uncharacterized protein n=1 Tax=Ricinus communis TaxID=3988 RepID=B9TBN2_RICCO|nr:conserved hypothetical protein [Ricinus communis]